jgi:hypothetical protein
MGITEVECVVIEMDEKKEKALTSRLIKYPATGIRISWLPHR